MRCIAHRVTCVAFGMLATVAAASAEDLPPEPSVANGIEPHIVDEPAFPARLPKDRVKIWTGAFFVPPTDFGSAELGLARPELRVRIRMPIDDVASVLVSGDFRASLYDTEGNGSLFPDCADCPAPGDLYSAAVAVQGGYLLNHRWHLFREDEHWAVVGALYGRARWEPGAFGDAVTPGLSLGIGYELPLRLRVSVAARVERALDGDHVKVAPTGYLRWDLAPKVRLRNRGLGLQIEYRPTNRVEIFATGYQSTDRFRLDDRPGLSSGPTFSDRQLLVGGGLTFKIAHAFRLTAETGAIVDRRIAIETRDDGRVDSSSGDTSPYFAIRAELRP